MHIRIGMKAIIYALGLILLAPFSTFCWAKPGFFSPGDSSVPSPVRSATQAVFRLDMPMRPAFVLKGSREGRKFLRGVLQGSVGDDFLEDWMVPQVGNCWYKPARPCLIYNRGSAFLAENAQVIWTAYHNVEPYIQSALELSASPVRQIKIPIRLINAEGEIVFGQTGDFVTVDLLNPALGGNGKITANYMDYARLQLSRPLAGFTPLQFAAREQRVALGTEVFLVGFPRSSIARTSQGVPDSDGRSQFVSMGQVLDIKIAYKRWRPYYDLPSEETLSRADHTELHFDGDSLPGSSGGPVLDRSGRVVGVYNSSSAPDVGPDMYRWNPNLTSMAVRASYIQSLR